MDDKRWEQCKQLLELYKSLYSDTVIGLQADELHLSNQFFKLITVGVPVQNGRNNEYIELSAELDGIKIITLI